MYNFYSEYLVPLSIVLLLFLGSATLVFGIVKGITYNATKYEWVCPESVTYAQRENKILECITNTRKGITSCTYDINSFYCKREKIE